MPENETTVFECSVTYPIPHTKAVCRVSEYHAKRSLEEIGKYKDDEFVVLYPSSPNADPTAKIFLQKGGYWKAKFDRLGCLSIPGLHLCWYIARRPTDHEIFERFSYQELCMIEQELQRLIRKVNILAPRTQPPSTEEYTALWKRVSSLLATVDVIVPSIEQPTPPPIRKVTEGIF